MNFALANFFVVITFVLVDIGVVIYGPYGDLGISYETINNGWALNYAGLAVGCILFIPFVYRYGRRPVYIFSMLFQFAATIWNAKLNHGGELLAAYTLAGVGGAISETIVQITIGDLYFIHERATANGIFITMQNVGSYIGPVVAGYIAVNEGWRWIWWWSAIFLAINFILVLFFFEETTYIPKFTGRSATPIQQDSDSEKVRGKSDDISKQPSTKLEQTASLEQQPEFKPKSYRERLAFITKTPHNPGDFKKHFYQPFVVLFAFPAVLYAALTYGAVLSWYSVISTVESEYFLDAPYDWDSAQIGLFNLAPFIGGLIGAVIGGPLNDYAIMWMARRNGGVYEPEMRLWISLPAIIICPLGILMFGFGLANVGRHLPCHTCLGPVLIIVAANELGIHRLWMGVERSWKSHCSGRGTDLRHGLLSRREYPLFIENTLHANHSSLRLSEQRL